ncbi:MAG: iron-containing alcohol dehydrogenase family protein, partial [bacterium]
MLQIAPHRYQSAPGALQDIGKNLEQLGERALVIANKTVIERFEDVVRKSLKDSMIGFSFDVCLGECCLPEIERLVSIAEKQESDMIIGMGGGKTLDVAKYVAQLAGCKLITVPTVVSSCAAFTNVVHLYNEDGEFIKEEELDNSPDLLILDYKIAGLAPSRHFAAGMSLAFAATSGEFSRGDSKDLLTSYPSRIALELAGHVRREVFERGKSAFSDVKKGELTAAIEEATEIIILETGLIHCLGGGAFRNSPGRLFAHFIHPYIDDNVLFGELVGLGTIIERNLYSSSVEELKDIYRFYRDIEIPLTLSQLGVPENQRGKIFSTVIEQIVKRAAEEPFAYSIDAKELEGAIRKADKDGE